MEKKEKLVKSHSFFSRSIASENPEINSILHMMERLLHWAAIIESSDDAIISISVDSTITSWNKGAEQLYGYKEDEILGKPTSVLMPPSKKDDFPKIMKMLHEGKRVEHYETKRMSKYGKILDVSITVSPIRDSNGNIIGASKIARNISERVEQEKRRDEFVSTASHELKTPITSQKVFGELLEKLVDKNGYKELKPYVQKMNAQTNKLTKLVEDLLELSRVQNARLKIDQKKFDLDNLVSEIVENTKLITAHKIIKKGSGKKLVLGDRERVGQVLTNLLSNAIKYSPKADKIIVSIKVSKIDAVVSVQDFGIGVSKEYFDKIFEQFFRATNEDEKTFPGMGIGLFLSKEIITRHGGKIWVKSEKGKGSTFYFSLPLNT